jgi:UDP-N-acetylmuramyl pentapeptide synthase
MILNGDDELLMETAMGFNRRVHTYGTRPNNEIRISRIEDEGQDGSRFVLEYDEETLEVRIHVPGFHNIMNAAAAASVAMLTGVDKEKISSGLKIYRGTQGRFTPLVISENITLLDDSYNSNPSSLRAMLQTVKAIAGGSRRIIVALGEMLELGEETIPAHIEAGEMVAETKADLFLAMGEHAGYMLKGAVDRGFPSAIAVEVKSHEEMIEKIRDVMKENDLILVKGSRRIGLDRVVRGLREE